MTKTIISKNLRHLRKKAGLTQVDLADKLGVTRARIGSHEEGRSEPGIVDLLMYSAFYSITVDSLIKEEIQ